MSKPITEEAFLKDVASHKMTVLKDDGVYRHLKFSAGTFNQWFELVNFPNVLVINGDMGTWTFSRVEDMFTFFRCGDQLKINPSYWSEKVTSASKFGGPEEKFSREVWEKAVLQYVDDYADDSEQRESIKAALREDIFNEDESEPFLRRALADFEHDGFEFTDSWEIDGKEYTNHFLWCLYAIVWGIQQYDATKVEVAA